MPRATLYRMLKVLSSQGFIQVAPGTEATYQLGGTIARLASRIPQPTDLLSVAPAVMKQLAADIGETVKLVVLDGLEAVTVAVAEAQLEAKVTARVGTRVPLHIGASQRLLLAHAGAAVWRQVLSRPLERRTARTVCDPQRLRASLDRLRMAESAQTQGEGIDGVGAAATLIRGANDRVIAALVAVYIHPGKTRARLLDIRERVELAARDLSAWRVAAARP
jgi:DNA-binding IclR family transcriptional regulator